jgi:hypothetical protein
MAGTGVVASPVLVGRDEFLQLVRRRLTEAGEGHGELLLVSGEAGIGKTRLLRSVVTQARTMGFAVAQAAAFPADTASSAGLLFDLAADLRSAPEEDQRDLGERLGERVRAIGVDDPGARSDESDRAEGQNEGQNEGRGDAHHRRRLLEQDVAGLLTAMPPGRPWLIVLEDLHWADQVSLDVLARLAPRLRSRPMLIAAAYRSDELASDRPLRELRVRLLPQRLAEEIRLPRLSLDPVSVLAGAVTVTVVPAQVVRAVYERSDGIPLHVEELLACLDHGALTPQSGPRCSPQPVPETLGDALLSRLGALSGPTRAVAVAAAVLGRSFDFDLLTVVTGAEPEAVAVALRELREASLVLPGADEATFDFRHALIRDALYADTDLPGRRRCMPGWPRPQPPAVTEVRWSRRITSWPGSRTGPTPRPAWRPGKPARCRPTAKRCSSTAGPCATVLLISTASIVESFSRRSAMRRRRWTTIWPRRRPTTRLIGWLWKGRTSGARRNWFRG